MAPRLKVFVTSDGLTDYVVATTSKAKALAAWGSHQDLFRTGLAHETDDTDLAKEAAAQPGVVLRRPAGTRAALSRLKAPKPKPARPSKAALERVEAIQRQLSLSDNAHAKKIRDLDRKREALEARHRAARARLEDRLSAARRALGS